jgi:ribonuclease-3
MLPAVLETSLGYEFKQKDLLELALTHRSHSGRHNERLEFLGDSVLNCAVAYLLFERFNKIDEGDLSRLRANLVKQASLADIAQRLEIARFLRLGEGELKSGGFRRPSILADTLEALFGAVMLDGGFDAARLVITKLYTPILETVDPKTLGKDAKTLLQEYLQGRKIALPIYTVVATHGAAHNQEFEVECAIPKLEIQLVGTGGSRRAAEQGAAKKALEAAMASNPAPAKRTSRARKQAQLSLPVATIQSPESLVESPEPVAAKPAKEPALSKDSTPKGGKDGMAKEVGVKDAGAKEAAPKEAAAKEASSKDAGIKDVQPIKEAAPESGAAPAVVPAKVAG